MSDITREIMWNIPTAYKALMYLLFIISLVVMGYGFYRKFKFVAFGGPLGDLKGPKGLFFRSLQWKQFLKTIFFTGKVFRNSYVGIFHALIFYGFLILWIATDLVAVHYDTPLKIFQGSVYIVISFLADIAGIMIMAGIGLAFYRRYIKKPDYLSATSPKNELYMYLMLLFLVVLGYLIEGMRILGNNMPELERSVAPLGWAIASWFQSLTTTWALSDYFWGKTYQVSWLIHMISTMIFIASIPYTKFFHMFSAPFSALITPPFQGAVLNPMNFEDEGKESFGLESLKDFTLKQRWDLVACVECGRCTQVCPANLAGKPLNPKLIITKARDFAFTHYNNSSAAPSLWEESPLYASNELDSCTTCGACMQECPVHIEHVGIIMEAKRYKVLTQGDIPPAAADAVNKIKKNGNPWGITQEDRFKWADGLEIPVISPEREVEYLYYVGCAGSYDGANQAVVRDTVSLLKKANVNFAVIGKTEKCNGDPVRRFGDEYSFFEIAIENISTLRQFKFKKIVTHCPHCLHTLGKEYAKFEDGTFEVVHHTELLAELIKNKKLIPEKKVALEEVTFHDPCYLGRHHGTYSAPRSILEAIPGIELKEMERSKDKALCCGMGGGNMWYELPEGEHLSHNRLNDVEKTKAKTLATGCSFCLINFNSSKGHTEKTENLQVKDVANILAESVLS